MGFRQVFAPIQFVEDQPLATREYFPQQFRRQIAQPALLGGDVERGPAFGEADVFFGGTAKDFGDFFGITQFKSPAEGFLVEHKQ